MRQTGDEVEGVHDPLKRIQQEINEVRQRELELRNQLRFDKSNSDPDTGADLQQQGSDDSGISTTSSSPVNGTSANNTSPHRFVDHSAKVAQLPKKNHVSNPIYVRSTSAAAFVFAPRNPKPAKIDYYLPPREKTKKVPSEIPPKRNENMLTRTVSTPQLFQPKSGTHRSFMQRFIETRGKLSSNVTPVQPLDKGPLTTGGMIISPTAQIAGIQRDSNGKPMRKGFIPVEEKIQKELRDMRHREFELKIQRQKSVQYDCNHNLVQDTKDDESDPYNSLEFEEQNFKLRSSKSISELSDYSPRNSPSPQFERMPRPAQTNLRPALSLAQLCDMDPEEVVSPNRLIAQFECLIQKKRSKVV